MIGYMLCCKSIQTLLDALNILRGVGNLKYDVNPDTLCIYFNQIEITCIPDECMKELIIPRRRYLRELQMTVNPDGSVEYGKQNVSTGTTGLLQKIKNCGSIPVFPGLVYYPRKNSMWVRSSGFYKTKDIKDNKGKVTYDPVVIDYYNILKKLTSKVN